HVRRRARRHALAVSRDRRAAGRARRRSCGAGGRARSSRRLCCVLPLKEGNTMRLVLVALLSIVAAIAAPGAQADGSPYAPGLVQGASGVLDPSGALRFVTLATPRSTVVAAIGVRSGRVVRSAALRGFYGVPL